MASNAPIEEAPGSAAAPGPPAQPALPPDHRSSVMKCINRIPLCGNYCGPTISPELSCLRHVSNEGTPPLPCLGPRSCRSFFEHNSVVRGYGRVGFGWAERRRRSIFLMAFCVSVVTWAFTIFAACSITNRRKTLVHTNFVHTRMDRGSVKSWIGITHVSVKENGSWRTKKLSNACDDELTYYSKSLNQEVVTLNWKHKCHRCEHATAGAVALIVTSTITQFFQITMDLQRSTRFGDLNCQKMFGTVTGVYGLISTLQAFRIFRQKCYLKSDTPPWRRRFDVDVVAPALGFARSRVQLKIRPGIAFQLLFACIILKTIDIICHIIIPTPRQKHDHPETERLSLPAYMYTAGPTDDDNVDEDKAQDEKADDPSEVKVKPIKMDEPAVALDTFPEDKEAKTVDEAA